MHTTPLITAHIPKKDNQYSAVSMEVISILHEETKV